MKISILIPTRKRPMQIERIIDELQDSLNDCIELVLGIDEDDDSYDIKSIEKISGIKIVRTPKTKYLSSLYNILFEYSSEDIIGYCSDDVSFLNTGIFHEVIDTFKVRGNILYYFSPCSHPYPRCVPDHGFVTAKSVRRLGFLALPNMEHGYIDHYIGRMYKETDCYHRNTTSPITHLRSDLPEDETYFIKSKFKDKNGMICDDRDLIRFNDYAEKYLEIHKSIIVSLNQ